MSNKRVKNLTPLKNALLAENAEHNVLADKFLQTQFYPVCNKDVKRLIQSTKFLLDRTGMQLKQLPDFDFGSQSQSANHSFSADYDMCDASVRFYASAGKNNGVDLHMFHTLKSGHDTFSISHYYLPKAAIESAVFIARICSHGNNGQVHINWNGETMAPNKSHIHIVTKYYQQLELNKANGNKAEATKRMAYADAIEIDKLQNIAVCARFAQSFFNLAPTYLALPMQEFASKTSAEFNQSIALLQQQFEQLGTPSSAPTLPKMNKATKYDKSQKNRDAQTV